MHISLQEPGHRRDDAGEMVPGAAPRLSLPRRRAARRRHNEGALGARGDDNVLVPGRGRLGTAS